MIDELRDQEKTSVLLISHDLLLVKHRCKKIAVMKSGKVIECSNAEMLFKNPKQKYSRTLIDALDYKKSKDVSKKHETDILYSINNLYKTYASQGKDLVALKNINIDIYKNEILGIVGESASGKSTLAKILLQIVPQDKGDIMFYSTGTTPIIHEKPNRLIGTVFQDTLGSLNPRMSIFDILMEPLDLTDGLDLDTKINKLNKCIKSVGLSIDLLERYPHMLSGGQRQRVSIARALMTDPSLLILDDDEPFTRTLSRAMARRGFIVKTLLTVHEGLSYVKENPPAYAVIDLRLGDGNGLDVVEKIREKRPDSSIVVLTGYGAIATAVAAVKIGAVDYLSKPAGIDVICSALFAPPSEKASPPEEPMSANRVRWEHIQRVYELCDKNVSETARRLKMHRRTLQRILSKRAPN